MPAVRKKRSPPSRGPSFSPKRAKTQPSHGGFATPDDPRSIASSAAPSRPNSAEVEDQTLASPACPGVIRNRGEGTLSRLPPDSDVFETFAKLRKDNELSDEEAFFKFITTYDVPIEALNRISGTTRLPASFSNVKYKEIAEYVWLDPSVDGDDILPLDTFRSRIPSNVFRNICTDVDNAILQYGMLGSLDNEEARSRFIASLFSQIVCLFGSAVVNKPEGLLDAEFTKKGRIEHHFYAVSSISIVFIQVKKNLVLGKGKLDIIGQVLAECAACDYANSKVQHWVPILAILCDGERFEFIVYDSGSKHVYSSGIVTGLVDRVGKPQIFALSIKETTEYLFDYFLMAYINGLRSFGHKSNLAANRSKSKKCASTEEWMNALARAEQAHLLVRKAAVLASKGDVQEAEKLAARGVGELMESVVVMPRKTQERILESCWDGDECIETALKEWNWGMGGV